MKLGIMQPYFFPYLGYFALIAHTDRWVVFDVTQYTPKTWMNRNRILHPTKGWQYVTVPLDKASMSIKIKDAKIKDVDGARRRILGQLDHYRKTAPHFPVVCDLVEKTFGEIATDSLVDLNVIGLRNVCTLLGLRFDYLVCSRDIPSISPVSHAGGWALEISSSLGATHYMNPMGGREIFKASEFRARGIELSILPPPKLIYDCAPYEFVEHLSILDVLMWNKPETVRDALISGTAPVAAQ